MVGVCYSLGAAVVLSPGSHLASLVSHILAPAGKSPGPCSGSMSLFWGGLVLSPFLQAGCQLQSERIFVFSPFKEWLFCHPVAVCGRSLFRHGYELSFLGAAASCRVPCSGARCSRLSCSNPWLQSPSGCSTGKKGLTMRTLLTSPLQHTGLDPDFRQHSLSDTLFAVDPIQRSESALLERS